MTSDSTQTHHQRLEIREESPLTDDLGDLFARHVAAMHADTPPESIYMMPRETLVSPEIKFLVMRDNGKPVGMGAIKRLDTAHGEIKSMHILAETRGRGLAAKLVDELIAVSRAWNLERLSLETGTQDSFAAARAVYARAGFTECGPFADYKGDPTSFYMTREI